MFACGTAAVITPVGALNGTAVKRLRRGDRQGRARDPFQALVDIQYGHAEDSHDWMHNVVPAERAPWLDSGLAKAHPFPSPEEGEQCTSPTRTEHDLLGDREVPADAYWGIHTLRALENFPITGIPSTTYPYLIEALAAVKEAAATANDELGLLDDARVSAIRTGLRGDSAGALHEEFVVDVIQGGAGTSTNMNANEVIANRALELLGHQRGRVPVPASQRARQPRPVDQRRLPDRGQDRDHLRGRTRCSRRWQMLRDVVRRKADEFHDVLKMGRTQLQDAVPMTLGQEFAAYASCSARTARGCPRPSLMLHEINLGATAIGTGLNATRRLRCSRLRAPRDTHRPAAGHGARPGRGDPGLSARSSTCPACSSGSR